MLNAHAIVERWYHDVLSGGRLDVIDEIFDPCYVAYHLRMIADERGGEHGLPPMPYEKLPERPSGRLGLEQVKREASHFRRLFSRPVFSPALITTSAALAPRGAGVVAFDVSMSAVDQHGAPIRERGIELWVVAGGRIRCSADTWDWWISEAACPAPTPAV